ncbi:transketolase C-terminal domain-containing protein, partial [Parafannyhessea umbonata]|uniref:transketolase family protein n=1 Tax=Parafannyhessea umbonata TaxID=604330 RepID=UPI002A80765A
MSSACARGEKNAAATAASADGRDALAGAVTAEESARFSAMNPKQVFGEVMGELAERDGGLSVVVSDYGRRLNLDHMREVLPEGFVQCGIAEQNQVEVAAALANEGLTTFAPSYATFAPSYATFITGRVYDQIRVNLGMMRSPVALVGVSAGCESGMLGASHMALEDISLMRGVPNVEVFCPADNAELASVLRLLAAVPRPAYVRTNTLDGTNLHPDGTTAAVGRAQRIFSPEGAPEVSLVATGTICSRAVEAARLLAADGVAAEVLEMLTVKPLDVAAVDALAAGGRRLVA